MLNILWPIFIIISIIYSFISGNVENLNNEVFDSVKEAVEMTIGLLGTMCLWCGLMKILEETTLINKITKLLKPIVNFLFPEMKNNKKVIKEVSMNMVANILGLGNAATPLGLKAIKTMQDENIKKDTLSNSMAMFILINTASLQVIPTTVLAIRHSLGSKESTSIIIPVWCATIAAALAGIITTKLFIRLKK